MGRLFWKFFFSYWAALLVAVLGVGTAGWLYQLAERNPVLSLEAGPRANFIVTSAAATLRHGGLPALRELMEDRNQQSGPKLYAVDGADRDLLGRGIPADSLDQARQLANAHEKSDVVRRVRLPDGQDVLLFIPVESRSLFHRLLFRGGPPSPLVPLATGTLASLVFGALLAWYVARPIRHLRGAFASVSQGKLETRVAPLIGRRRDEVADLGRDFDRMAQQLQSLIAAQRSLLHDVSHELRSPLARLQAAIGLARQNPQKMEGSLERIEREADRVDELVGQLLTLARLEASGTSQDLVPSERIDLVDLIASIAADAHFEAQANGRSVTFAGEGELYANVRVELLHRAIENVIRNAVKYTAPGTTVEVSVSRAPSAKGVLVTVADRGPGVAETELERIFEPFYRSPGGLPGPGFGLGLAIARRAVEAHGGHVRATNRDGGGLLLEISLPLEFQVS